MRTILPIALSLGILSSAWAAILPPDAIVGGRTQAEWAAEWWKWAFASSTNSNPLLDMSGVHAWNAQPGGPVLFLAGVHTTGNTIRRITIPEGKYLFFPMVNVRCGDPPDPPLPEQYEECVDAINGALMTLVELHASINSVSAPNPWDHRIGPTPPFAYQFDSCDSIYSLHNGECLIGEFYFVDDGYYLLVEPLPVGTHEIKFGGAYEFGSPIEAIYHITVVPATDLVIINPTSSPNEGTSFKVLGPEGSGIIVQAIESLGDGSKERWQSLETYRLGSGPYEFMDAATSQLQSLFYRVVRASEGGQSLPPDAVVGGKTQAEWSAEWWKWAMSTSTNQNPFLDATGEWADQNQPGGDVFFLVGLNTISGTVVRTITVAEGQHLFFPILNSYCDNTGVPPPGYTVEELRECGAHQVAATTGLHASINWIEVPNLDAHRQISPVFNYFLESPDSWLSHLAGSPVVGLIDPAVADGFYLIVEPLPPGIHVLNFGGTQGDQFQFSIDITYTITVVAASLE